VVELQALGPAGREQRDAVLEGRRALELRNELVGEDHGEQAVLPGEVERDAQSARHELVRSDPLDPRRCRTRAEGDRRRDPGSDPVEERQRERHDLRWYAIGVPELLHVGLLGTHELREDFLPRLVGDRPRCLSDVAQDRQGARGGAPDDHAQLHGREVLRLVDDHVAERPRALAEQRVRLVDERHVVLAPGEPCARTHEQPLLIGVEDPLGGRGEPRARGEDPADEALRRHGRPDAVEPAREEPLRPHRTLDVAEVAPREPAEARSVVLVEPAEHVHAKALSRVRRQPELVANRLE
jgi:hypothetical protein